MNPSDTLGGIPKTKLCSSLCMAKHTPYKASLQPNPHSTRATQPNPHSITLHLHLQPITPTTTNFFHRPILLLTTSLPYRPLSQLIPSLVHHTHVPHTPTLPHPLIPIQQSYPFLSQYSYLFTIPLGLPPKHQVDHKIALFPNTKRINVCPYRYPHFHKAEIEGQV